MEILTLKDSYKFYRKDNPRLLSDEQNSSIVPKEKNNQDQKLYFEILYGFIKFMMEKIFEGHDVRLGANLGTQGVRGKKLVARISKDGKIMGLPIDWGTTNKLRASNPQAEEEHRLVFHLNEHSDGIRYNLFWSKKGMIVKNKTYYTFDFSKGNVNKPSGNQYRLSQYIKAGREYLLKIR